MWNWENFESNTNTILETMKIHNNDYISTFAYESIQNCDEHIYCTYVQFIFLSETH